MHPRRRFTPILLVAFVFGLSILPISSARAAETCPSADVTHTGADATPTGNGDGTIEGSEGDDVIDGSGGTYTIDGLGGNDRICAGDGDDQIFGGGGEDILDDGPGNDIIAGGADNDDVRGDAGDDVIFAGLGNDTIDGGPSSDSGGDWIYFSDAATVDLKAGTSEGSEGTDLLTNLENVYGSPEPDTIFGDDGPNYLVGWEGNDFIAARAGDDVVNGMDGHDAMFGGSGLSDWLVYFDANAQVTVDLQTDEATVGSAEQDGLSGFESLAGSDHDDFLYGNAGTNYLAGGDGEDTLAGRGGFDIATFYRRVVANLGLGEATSLVNPPVPPPDGEIVPIEQIDTLVGLEGLWGSSDWDTLIGDGSNNLLRGDAEVDEMRGGGGQDYFLQEEDADREQGDGYAWGGPGSYDVLDYSLSPLGIEINLQSEQLEGQALGIEGLIGSRYQDTFTGTDGANYLFGQKGNDVLRGKGGKDGLAGGEGNGDKLVGGRAVDRCVEGEQTLGCEENVSPARHPLASLDGTVSRPATLEAMAFGPDDPRRYK